MSFTKKTVIVSIIFSLASMPLASNCDGNGWGDEIKQMRKDISKLTDTVTKLKDSDFVERSRVAALEVFDKGMNHSAKVSVEPKTWYAGLGFAGALASIYLFYRGVNATIDSQTQTNKKEEQKPTLSEGLWKMAAGVAGFIASSLCISYNA